MSGDVPVPIISDSKDHKEFLAANVADIKATIQFMYDRGMWSEFHYKHWMKMVDNVDAEMAHLWWDAITSGAMFEMESPQMEMIEAKTEKMEEMAEEAVEEKFKMKQSSFACDGTGPKKSKKRMKDM